LGRYLLVSGSISRIDTNTIMPPAKADCHTEREVRHERLQDCDKKFHEIPLDVHNMNVLHLLPVAK
jgi:hypothetical protein